MPLHFPVTDVLPLTITSCQTEKKVEKKGWHLEGGRQKCLLGLESKFDCPLCRRVQNYSKIHISETCDKEIYIYLKITPQISKHQMFFQIRFPKSKCWYFEDLTHTLSLSLSLILLSFLLIKRLLITFVVTTDEKQGNKEKICFDSKKCCFFPFSNYFLPTLFFAHYCSGEVSLGISETCMDYTFSQNPYSWKLNIDYKLFALFSLCPRSDLSNTHSLWW